jgi:hypothetical protein
MVKPSLIQSQFNKTCLHWHALPVSSTAAHDVARGEGVYPVLYFGPYRAGVKLDLRARGFD